MEIQSPCVATLSELEMNDNKSKLDPLFDEMS